MHTTDASPPPPPPPAPPAPPAAPSGRRPDRQDPGRAGAIWVTGTGAFLLVVAAAVFVAVRWDQIPEVVKLAVLAGASGASLLVGRRLRPALPATGSVLFHLGAFLLPVTAAAVTLRLGATSAELVLVEGLVGSVVFPLLARAERSVVLRAAGVLALPVAAVGLAATTGTPTALPLAAAAVVALHARRSRAALTWSLLAAAAPLATLALPATAAGTWLAGPAWSPTLVAVVHLVTGGISAAVLGALAARRNDTALLIPAVLAALVGAIDSAGLVDPGASGWVTAAAAAFVAVELAARWCAADRFWGAPTRWLAAGAEGVALTTAGATAALAVVGLPALSHGEAPRWSGTYAAATALALGGWLLAERRHDPAGTAHALVLAQPGGTVVTSTGLLVTLVAGATATSWWAPAVAVSLVLGAVTLVAAGRPGAHGLAAGAVAVAPAVALGHPGWMAATAAAGTAVLTWCVVLRAGVLAVAPGRSPDTEWPWLLTVAALAPGAVALPLLALDLPLFPLVAATAAGWWLVGAVLDATPAGRAPVGVGLLPEIAATATLLAAPQLEAAEVALLAAGLSAAAVARAALGRRSAPAFLTSVSVPIAVVAATLVVTGSLALAGVVLTVAGALAGAAWMGVGAAWRWPVGTLALTAAGCGVLLASEEVTTFAAALMITGTATTTGALTLRQPWLAGGGWAVATAGLWVLLDQGGVTAWDAYVAPVAVGLAVAGLGAVRRGGGSWVALGPAICLLAITALAERLAGGGTAHALVAGLVGTAAVVVGGWQRWSAPLVLGTATLVGVTATETLAFAAGVPTWAWLAAAGSLLVAVGILLERAQLGPVESGRRVVDLVRDHFA